MPTLLDDAESVQQRGGAPGVRAAELALLFATLVWGSSFAWAKQGGDALNRLTGTGPNSPVGPLMLMGWRFLGAGILWVILFPRSRRGWSSASLLRGLLLGSLMGVGLVLQVLGLDRTSEAVSAFLTSLSIIWVPTIMTLALGRPPAMIFWAGVALAAAGVWLMTGAVPGGFGIGELLGLGCSVVFSVHIIALNGLLPRDDPFRMTAAQLLVAGLIPLLLVLFVPSGAAKFTHAVAFPVWAPREVWLNLVLLVLFPTLVSFGLMTFFQPRVDPTRAALIYLTEPIFAAIYAWIFVGRNLGKTELLGAALILAANAMVELVNVRSRRMSRRQSPDRSEQLNLL
jgi:drug/metabolite transporter (DMT)-like permease